MLGTFPESMEKLMPALRAITSPAITPNTVLPNTPPTNTPPTMSSLNPPKQPAVELFYSIPQSLERLTNRYLLPSRSERPERFSNMRAGTCLYSTMDRQTDSRRCLNMLDNTREQGWFIYIIKVHYKSIMRVT